MSDELRATQIDRDHWFKMWETARAELAAERDAIRAKLAALEQVICDTADELGVKPDNEAMLIAIDAIKAERDALRAAISPVVNPKRIYHIDRDDDLILIGVTVDELARIDAAVNDAAALANLGDG